MSPDPGAYAIMLPGFFIHKAYLEMMFDPVIIPSDILEYTNTIINCDDILFSMMVTRFVRSTNLAWTGGMAVEPKTPITALKLCKLASGN